MSLSKIRVSRGVPYIALVDFHDRIIHPFGRRASFLDTQPHLAQPRQRQASAWHPLHRCPAAYDMLIAARAVEKESKGSRISWNIVEHGFAQKKRC